MKDNLYYRQGSINDLPQLMDLQIAAFEQFKEALSNEHWQTLSSFLNNEEHLIELINKATVFLCCNPERIIGAAYFIPAGNPTPTFIADWCYIRMVSVHPAHRGMGISKKLTGLCIDHARDTNEKMLTLHTSEFMDAARHIYERLGFKKEKEIEPLYGKRYWLYSFDLQAEVS